MSVVLGVGLSLLSFVVELWVGGFVDIRGLLVSALIMTTLFFVVEGLDRLGAD